MSKNWVLFEHESYSTHKIHRGIVDDETGLLTVQCNAWAPLEVAKFRPEYDRIIAVGDVPILTYDSNLCGTCFPKKRRVKVQVSATSGGRTY